ncbi:MAG: insulinase family protein [Acidobacteria bacterium]|nr:insulinase family protein [Acidobacteriota bacterium]
MKKNLISLLLILAFMPTAGLAQKAKPVAAKPTATTTVAKPQAAPYEIPITVKTLANGMQIIVLPDSSVPLVTVELAVRNGSFTEPPELNGLSHLYEHMFFKTNRATQLFRCEKVRFGNPQMFRQFGCDAIVRLKPEIGDPSYFEQIDELGIVNNASTREEVVNFYFTTTTPNLTPAMRFIRDAARFPAFDEEDLTTEREAVLAELERNMSQPGYYLNQAMLERLFYKYPTRKSPGGTRETVSAATTEKMRLIQSRYYVPNNSALIVTGDVKPDEIFAQAEKLFGDWPKADDPFIKFPLVEHPPLTKSEGVIVSQPVQSILIMVGWQGPSIGKDDAGTYAADVFSFILRQPNSRFQRALVDSGLAAGADLGYYTQRNVGPIQSSLATTPDKAKAAVKALYTEIAQFDKPDYFTDEELDNAKALLEADDLFGREKLSEYAHTLSFWWSTTGIDYFRGYHKNLRATTRADISKYVKTYIQNKPHIGLALISPEQQAIAKLTPEDLIGGKQ